ncbi:ribbon-helix-helix domain-containing protein [Novosphingobium sp. G106]|uniref:ribbon-helix-helix domain-containing protein n=1 Tax=Novosphingobium sp. G106 TaxID=2849500 RepID=UPI001C2D0173|nr:ribbon-helix-helix domain-containing protein [Novosphingobium sp. G106]MBV1691478.1 ribbon-helix-helix domain-containing protein [Novosphingobium sp. G106]
MTQQVRYQLFLPKPLSDRFEALAARPGTSKSAILVDAVTAWLNRRGTSELEDRFGIRLDRMTAGIGRIERDNHIQIETEALLVRYVLAVLPPLAENDQAGRALAAKRFEAFIAQVGKQIAAGRRTFPVGLGQTADNDQ